MMLSLVALILVDDFLSHRRERPKCYQAAGEEERQLGDEGGL